MKKKHFDPFLIHFTSVFHVLRVISGVYVYIFVFFMYICDLWDKKNNISNWNFKDSFGSWIPSDLKTSNPVLNSKLYVCITHKKIKTICMKIDNFSITEMKIENPSDQIYRIDVLNKFVRGNLKILRIN